MSRDYLRVADTWGLLVAPTDKKQYMLNISGVSIQIVFSDVILTTDPRSYPFTVGGPTGSITIEPNTYMYARAYRDGSTAEAFLILDEEKVSPEETTDLRTCLEQLSVEVMRLCNRVSETEIKQLDSDNVLTLFFREYENSNIHTQNRILDNTIAILNNNLRLFNGEQLFLELKRRFDLFEFNYQHSESSTEAIEALQVELSAVSGTIININTKVDELAGSIVDPSGVAKELVEEAIQPVTEDLSDLRKLFIQLNNALVELSCMGTPTEIKDKFDTLIATVDESMKGPITAIRDIVLEISHNRITDAAQTDEIDDKLDQDDSLIIEPSIDLLSYT